MSFNRDDGNRLWVCQIMPFNTMSEEFRIRPSLHYNDPAFIQISVAHPIQFVFDRVWGNQLCYREYGPSESREAVVFLPGIYETVSSSCYMLSRLEKLNFRCIALDLAGYTDYKKAAHGFDQLCVRRSVDKVHIIGSDFGGFLGLQIMSSNELEVKVMSITLINSFTSTYHLPKLPIGFSMIGKLQAKTILFHEIENTQALADGSRGALFASQEIDYMERDDVFKRLQFRIQIPNKIEYPDPPSRIMSIETLDRRLLIPEQAVPSVSIKGVKLALMKEGGDWPHIDFSEDILHYIVAHLHQWGYIPNLSPDVDLSQLPPEQEKPQEEEA